MCETPMAPFPSPHAPEPILPWLREGDPGSLDHLWQKADEVRRQHVGDEVHLRGLVEISNHCVRQCAYCGISSKNPAVQRYRMTESEILACAQRIAACGFGTIVMQSGEDYGIETAWMARIVRQIKSETPLAVTLSLGERPIEDLAAWKEAGADRYLLRFETSDRRLYDLIHPPRHSIPSDRLAILQELRQLGYQTGSGVMVGIPGQTYASLAADIRIFREMDLDMVGVGPYIPHPMTPLGSGQVVPPDAGTEQVPNTELMTCKVLALTRLVCPEANLPSTTALATLNREKGRELGLTRGANVVMPNFTPPEYRARYEIYPNKACLHETHAFLVHLAERLDAIGRVPGRGPGHRRRPSG